MLPWEIFASSLDKQLEAKMKIEKTKIEKNRQQFIRCKSKWKKSRERKKEVVYLLFFLLILSSLSLDRRSFYDLCVCNAKIRVVFVQFPGINLILNGEKNLFIFICLNGWSKYKYIHTNSCRWWWSSMRSFVLYFLWVDWDFKIRKTFQQLLVNSKRICLIDDSETNSQ